MGGLCPRDDLDQQARAGRIQRAAQCVLSAVGASTIPCAHLRLSVWQGTSRHEASLVSTRTIREQSTTIHTTTPHNDTTTPRVKHCPPAAVLRALHPVLGQTQFPRHQSTAPPPRCWPTRSHDAWRKSLARLSACPTGQCCRQCGPRRSTTSQPHSRGRWWSRPHAHSVIGSVVQTSRQRHRLEPYVGAGACARAAYLAVGPLRLDVYLNESGGGEGGLVSEGARGAAEERAP